MIFINLDNCDFLLNERKLISPNLLTCSYVLTCPKSFAETLTHSLYSLHVDNFDISEKVARLTQRLNHMPSISSGLRSDASSPKVQRKRRAVGPSAAVETKRRGIVRKEEEPEEETEDEDDDVKPEPQNFDVSKDELRELCCDDDDEGLPYEMVFKVNLKCCSASKKHNNYHKAKRSCKQSLSTSCAASSTSSTAKCSVPNKMRKETSTERRVLEQIQQEVDELGMFQFEGGQADCLHNNDNSDSSPVAMMLEEGVQEDEESMAVLASGAEDFWIAQPGYPLALQQPYLFPSFNNDSDLCLNNPAALQAYLSMQDPSSFMFLKNEPMILAQEERLGRNPYFIRTPPQVRRGVPPAATATPIAVPPPRIAAFYSADDGMEEEGSW